MSVLLAVGLVFGVALLAGGVGYWQGVLTGNRIESGFRKTVSKLEQDAKYCSAELDKKTGQVKQLEHKLVEANDRIAELQTSEYSRAVFETQLREREADLRRAWAEQDRLKAELLKRDMTIAKRDQELINVRCWIDEHLALEVPGYAVAVHRDRRVEVMRRLLAEGQWSGNEIQRQVCGYRGGSAYKLYKQAQTPITEGVLL